MTTAQIDLLKKIAANANPAWFTDYRAMRKGMNGNALNKMYDLGMATEERGAGGTRRLVLTDAGRAFLAGLA